MRGYLQSQQIPEWSVCMRVCEYFCLCTLISGVYCPRVRGGVTFCSGFA